MAKVGIVMGSDSDMPVMAKAAEILDKLGIDYEMKIISAHREPDAFFEYAKSAEEKGFKVIIAGAGKAAHLPGMCAAIFPMPVIGIPMQRRRSRRRGFPVFHRADAIRYSGSDRCHQRRAECRNSCGKDFSHIRSGTAGAPEGLQQGVKGAGGGRRTQNFRKLAGRTTKSKIT